MELKQSDFVTTKASPYLFSGGRICHAFPTPNNVFCLLGDITINTSYSPLYFDVATELSSD